MNAITLTLIIVTCVILGLGFAVVLNSRDRLNGLYFLNILTIIGWSVTMMYYRLSSDLTIVIWARLLYVAASLIASDFLYFTYVFPKYEKVSAKIKAWIFVPNIALIVLCLIGNTIITGAKVNPGGENFIYWGSLYPIYVIYILFYFNFAFYRLIKKRFRSTDAVEKIQLGFVILGYMSSGFIAFFTNLILPSLGIFVLNWVGQVSTVLMATSATYAIVKHRLFNAKVIATEILVFAIWMILLLRLLLSQTSIDMIYNGMTFLLTFFAGVLLIRGVNREVMQREALAAANAGQENLIHILNHQIKGYLAKARNIFAELMDEPAYGPVPEAAKPLLDEGFRSLTEGVTFTEQLLNAANAEKGVMSYDMKPMDMAEAIAGAVAMVKPAVDKKGLTLSFPGPVGDCRVAGDVIQLKEAVRNLIDNAVNYTPRGSITVSLERVHGDVIFTVKDTGVGIAPADMPKLFTKGGRGADSLKVNVNSTGYGLFFVKKAAEAHNGFVKAESPGRGKGSVFTLELPALRPAGYPQGTSPSDKQGGRIGT